MRSLVTGEEGLYLHTAAQAPGLQTAGVHTAPHAHHIQTARQPLPVELERRWLAHYPVCVPKTLKYPAVPAWGLLAHSACEFPERVACIHFKRSTTYGALAEQARRTAGMLVRLGVRPGDRVGILLPNVPEFLSTVNGIWMAGAAAVAISPLSVAEEVSALVAATGCRVVVSLDVLAPLLWDDERQPETVVLTTLQDRLPRWQRPLYWFARQRRFHRSARRRQSRTLWFDDEIARSEPGFEPVAQATLDEPAFLLATGGTTDHPKAVVLSHRNLVANAAQIHAWAGTTMGHDSVLAVVPFFHSYGLSSCALAGVSMAATIIMHHRFVPKTVLGLIEQYEPTVMPAVPAMLVALNGLLRARSLKYRALRYCISGGAPLDTRVAEEFARHTGAAVVEAFGLSEASPATHIGPLDGSARPGTIGLPLPDTDARIVDPVTGQSDVPPGEVGELIIKGPQVMLGYWNDPEATARTIRDGWLYTGDLAVEDAAGFFRIVDRKKDLIITSGFNVYPSDVEQMLRACPGVADVAVIGVPDVERGEVVKVVIVPQPGNQFTRRTFDAFCEKHLAKHKRPRVIEIADGDLPRNFLGKVSRRKLRDAHAEGSSWADLCKEEPTREETVAAELPKPELFTEKSLTEEGRREKNGG
jgi:long-chain acyl-CoA synthetase